MIGAANAAVAALVTILAVEPKPIRVDTVSPGVIGTPWRDPFPAEKEAMFGDFAGKTPVGRVGRSEEVAHAIAFLTDNGFVIAQTSIADGGLRFTAAA